MSVANVLTLSDQANVESRLEALEDQDVIFGSDLLQLTSRVDSIQSCGSYYKSTQQLASTGSTDISFDTVESWTDAGFIPSRTRR